MQRQVLADSANGRRRPLLDRSPSHLSGGERQRVAVCRLLLSQPGLLGDGRAACRARPLTL
ncbi:ATP-binding cassette domain-containing protein [Bradyrhizobium cenepequi]|uniref:ATP-binding cassette domain-containing protein n=1 Tax=Bradyrhizobium cenepequi TaxID=2821403 RepID=UPI0035D7EBD5